MATKQKYPAKDALDVAHKILEYMSAEQCAERAEIAGSLRREKPEVGDIEIVCVPRFQYSFNMFGEECDSLDMLDVTLQRLIGEGILEKRGGYGPQNKLLRHVDSGIPIDIFSTTIENWGKSLLVRTGSRDFNVRVMSELKRLGHQGHAYGGITLDAYKRTRREIPCPTESDVFAVLGWDYIPPHRRE